jgi:uncharacterized protein involved in cysteine biosynthesis
MLLLVLFICLVVLVIAICVAEVKELDSGNYLDVLGDVIERGDE